MIHRRSSTLIYYRSTVFSTIFTRKTDVVTDPLVLPLFDPPIFILPVFKSPLRPLSSKIPGTFVTSLIFFFTLIRYRLRGRDRDTDLNV